MVFPVASDISGVVMSDVGIGFAADTFLLFDGALGLRFSATLAFFGLVVDSFLIFRDFPLAIVLLARFLLDCHRE
jgi:hypothetical protein